MSKVGLFRLKRSTVLFCLKLSGGGQEGVREGKQQAILRNCLKQEKHPLKSSILWLFLACTAVSACLLRYLLSVIVFISKEYQSQMSSGMFRCGRRWVCCSAAHPTTGLEVMRPRAWGSLTRPHSPAPTQVPACPVTLATAMSTLAEEKRDLLRC